MAFTPHLCSGTATTKPWEASSMQKAEYSVLEMRETREALTRMAPATPIPTMLCWWPSSKFHLQPSLLKVLSLVSRALVSPRLQEACVNPSMVFSTPHKPWFISSTHPQYSLATPTIAFLLSTYSCRSPKLAAQIPGDRHSGPFCNMQICTCNLACQSVQPPTS